MTLSASFADATGSWAGSNGFRLMPGDPLATLPATATVNLAAGGHLLAFAYTWSHPDAGDHNGLLVVGADGDALTGIWGDSLHQQPAPMPMTGSLEADGRLAVAGTYAGEWEWRISIAAADGQLRMTMENVVPASAATDDFAGGPYPVMVAELRRLGD
jgi:hypothetical protein